MISKIIDGIEENVSGGSAGGGHVIENQSGTDMTQRANLQFIDATLADDSTNNRTKVEMVKELANASELASQPDGLYLVPESDPTDIDAESVGYDNTESELQSTNVQDAIDEVVEGLEGKVDKVSSPTSGNLAGLNASGNLTNAGWSADKTTTSVTGNPISISGLKSNQLAINPIITLEPIQAGSGDPSPSNVRAISGYDKIEVLSCGKNLVESIETGYYDYDTGATGSSNNYCRTSKFNIVGGKKYSLQVGVWGSPVNTIFYWKDDTYLGYDNILITPGVFTYTFTTREDANMCAISCGGSNYPITPERWGDVMVEYGEIATSFEPYNKSTDLSLQLGQTIYGGTLDIEKGILTVDRKCIDLGELNFGYDHSNQQYYSGELLNDAKIYSSSGLYIQNMICSSYPVDNRSYAELAIVHIRGIYTDQRLYIAADSDSYSFSGVQLVYELATPYTIQLTPHQIQLLSGYSYVSTNGTSMSFDYHNGEMASLGDVARLGQTVNELGGRAETIGILYGITNDAQYHTLQLLKAWDKFSIINIYVHCKTWGSAYLSMIIPTIAFKLQSQESSVIRGNDTDYTAINIRKGTNTSELSMMIVQSGEFNTLVNDIYVTGIY